MDDARRSLLGRDNHSISVGTLVERSPNPYPRANQTSQSRWRIPERNWPVSRFEHQSAAILPDKSIGDRRAGDIDRGKTLDLKVIGCSSADYQDFYSVQARQCGRIGWRSRQRHGAVARTKDKALLERGTGDRNNASERIGLDHGRRCARSVVAGHRHRHPWNYDAGFYARPHAYCVLTRMKSTADGTACPDDVAPIVADTFAATLNRRYAAPPPLSVTFTGAVSSGRVSKG